MPSSLDKCMVLDAYFLPKQQMYQKLIKQLHDKSYSKRYKNKCKIIKNTKMPNTKAKARNGCLMRVVLHL